MNLRQFKAKHGLTLTALARLLGRPISTVHGWLNDTRRPDWASIEDILRATGGVVTANDFQGGLPPAGFSEAQTSFATEARSLGLDTEAIAARAIRDAVAAEKARRWQEENRAAIEAHNRYLEEHGLPLAEHRMF